MIIRKIKFNTIESVKNFCNASMDCTYDIDLVSGRHVIDAKSIMGIFSLSLELPIELHINVDTELECADFINSVKAIDGINLI